MADREELPFGLFGEALEAPSPEADPHPGLRWNTWEIASIHAVDTARSGLLNVRTWRF